MGDGAASEGTGGAAGSGAGAGSGSGGDVRIETFALGPFETNCYLVYVEGSPEESWIVDAGFDPEALIERAEALGLRPSALLLTHAHADHIGGIRRVRARLGDVPVHLHAAEHRWLNDPELNLSAGFGVPVTAPGPDAELAEGDELRLGGSVWRVLHTPGHSPGSVTLHCEAGGVALVGDTLFNGSIGRFDFPTSDQAALFASIKEKLYAMPDETRVLPGHGPATAIGHEKLSNPYVRGEPHSSLGS